MSRRYFDEEMMYLREAGELFAETYPEVADKLKQSNVKNWDPYVERLLEGFAFLTGRIHERLDDNLTNYTESLFHLVNPRFLKPLPSTTILQFKPRRSLLPETQALPAGTEVHSNAVGEERASCVFRTTTDVRLQPIELDQAALDWRDGDSPEWPAEAVSKVRLRFKLDRGVDPTQLQLSPIRLYLNVDEKLQTTLYTIYEFLTDHVTDVWMTTSVAPDKPVKCHGQRFVQPAGFATEESLTPDEKYAFSGFRLLQEYLCFRQKFWFVDVFLGAGKSDEQQYELPEGTDWFDVHIFFKESYPSVESKRIKKEHIRLHCAPAVNLFERTAEPIMVEGLTSEYRVLPDLQYRKSVEAYDVQEVSGKEKNSGKKHRYYNFYTFRNANAPGDRRYFSERRHAEGVLGRPEILLSLSGADYEPLENLPVETLTVSLRCTNGVLPHTQKNIRLNQLGPGIPRIVDPSNLTAPSLILYPPQEKRKMFFWNLISHWSLNFRSVASREALVGLLELYDWTSEAQQRANRRRLDAIEDVSWKSATRMHGRGVMQGAHVYIRIKEDLFGDDGELLLFGRVLSEFFASYASINSFVHLTLEKSPSGKQFTWKPSRGERPAV